MADSNSTQIANFLLGKGLTREQTAGILGNLKIESGYSPTAYNANEGAIGIAQWEGGRRTALQAYAAKAGGKETDLGIQLGFLWQELTGSNIGALRDLATTTTPAAAAASFDQNYERSSGSSRQARVNAANAAYSSVGPSAGQPGYTWNPATGYANSSGQAFRGAGSAFTTSGPNADGSYNRGDPYSQPSVDGQILGGVASGIMAPLVNFLKPALFVVGGVALVVGGLLVAARPVARKAAQFTPAGALA